MEKSDAWSWDEDDYLETLRGERRRYAWVLRTYGGMPAVEAERAAEAEYPYEPPGAPYRGLVFHDEAWHWAMIKLKGEAYWRDYPELVVAPDAYRALD